PISSTRMRMEAAVVTAPSYPLLPPREKRELLTLEPGVQGDFAVEQLGDRTAGLGLGRKPVEFSALYARDVRGQCQRGLGHGEAAIVGFQRHLAFGLERAVAVARL